MRRAQLALGLLLATSALLPATQALHAADEKASGSSASKAETASEDSLPPLPEDASVRQSAVIGGKSVSYTATVGTIPVHDAKGKLIGEVVYTAYTLPGKQAENRPVTFAFNGGPGAASVYLNLGAIGPKRVAFGAQGDSPSDPAVLQDNPNSWLDFTDLVFIDPVGTGFSRSRADEKTTNAEFYAADADIHYLSRVIYDWLVKEERLASPKYLTGESYGGYRVPRLAYYLQTQIGIGVNGMVLVSPYLDPAAIGDDTALSPLPWMLNYPAMAAGHFERQGQHLDESNMGPVEEYLRTQFLADFIAGPRDKAATARLSARVAEFTGLDPELVQRMDGRIDIGTYLREIRRTQGLVGSVYDSNFTAYDPFPASSRAQYNDPLLTTLIAPTTSAMVDFVTRQVGWKVNARYNALSYEVNRAWDRDNTDSPVQDLRKAIAIDPKMSVDIVHGWDDLSCPYFASQLIIDQMPDFGQASRVNLHKYPGGHMFYSRLDSGAAMRRDILESYAKRN
ncbi:S10 family peptidase [Novosphingobium mangrovi (ex Hu et al. 2023)]|uniref:Peptidase S10 n=1 Tax=Novosphingobium mangrovi (ex Hu et al. 2023) TaxID=2930094 RepID=A0ABT0AG73_9SPHN|nr:peptidase S10 [Novosphingobium mangrovi (ex Hu et al. 2023)]MCJ1962199.1 peptidase S10 [Novosphingobium mangrovi (ex Hu et al. 2023)]